MPQYIYLYKGQATDPSAMSEEQRNEIMGQWNAYYGKMGDRIKDGGSPFAPGASVKDDGSAGKPAELTGYTIIEAKDMNEAKALTDGHPFLSEGKGKFAIDVFELMPVPGM